MGIKEVLAGQEKKKENTKRVSVSLRGRGLAAFNYLKDKLPKTASDAAIVEACIIASAMDEGFKTE